MTVTAIKTEATVKDLYRVVVRSYRADDPEHPLVFGRGDAVHAEPALPGWSLPVADLLLPPLGPESTGV